MCLTRARKIHSSCFKNCPARQELHAVWIWCILRLHKHGPSWEEKKQRRRMQHKSPFFIRRCPYFVQQLFTLLNCKANVTCPTGTCSNSSCIYWVQDNHSSINTCDYSEYKPGTIQMGFEGHLFETPVVCEGKCNPVL